MAKSRTLTKQKVIETAARLVNQSGDVEQLSLKEVAAALDIRVPSLYNHVKGLAGLRAELRLHALKEQLRVFQTAMHGKTGQVALISACHAYRTFAHDNKGLYPLTLAATSESEAEEFRQISADMLTLFSLVLSAYNLEGNEAVHALRALRSFLHGFVSLELGGGFGLGLDLDDSFEHMLTMFLGSIEESIGES